MIISNFGTNIGMSDFLHLRVAEQERGSIHLTNHNNCPMAFNIAVSEPAGYDYLLII